LLDFIKKNLKGREAKGCKDFTLAKASGLAVVHEANHSPASSAKVKNAWSCTSIPPYLQGMVLN